MIASYKVPSNIDSECFTAEKDALEMLGKIREYISEELLLRGINYNL